MLDASLDTPACDRTPSAQAVCAAIVLAPCQMASNYQAWHQKHIVCQIEKIKRCHLLIAVWRDILSVIMGYRRDAFAPDEYYHVFSRGIDKRQVYMDERDFVRFEKLLYLANDKDGQVNLELLKHLTPAEVFSLPRKKPLVAIGAYCLMDNHPHIVMQEKTDGGISAFMRKVGTGYTAYFNRKYDRIGNLMVKPFRAKHIADDIYLRRVIQYVHLNPAEIFEPAWKHGSVSDTKKLEECLLAYTHSSLPDYFPTPASAPRFQRNILDEELHKMISSELPPLRSVLEEAAAYYAEIDNEFDPKPRGRPRMELN